MIIENIYNQVSGINHKLLFQEFPNIKNKNFLKMYGKELWSFTRLNVLPDLDKMINEMEKKNFDFPKFFAEIKHLNTVPQCGFGHFNLEP